MESVINTSQYSNLTLIILYSVYSFQSIDFVRDVNVNIGNMYDRLTIKLSIALIILVALNVSISAYNLRKSPISNIEPLNYFTLPINENRASQYGIASWYDYDYPKGSGNWITKEKYVAASRFFPRGTILKVCHYIGIVEFEATGEIDPRCVDVVITDFGPEESTGRIIDLGSLAFSEICSLKIGLCEVLVREIKN